MLAPPSQPANSGLGGIDMGGMGNQQPASNDMGFGFGNDQAEDDGDQQADWATTDMFDSPASQPLDFAKPQLLQVLQPNQPGQKG